MWLWIAIGGTVAQAGSLDLVEVQTRFGWDAAATVVRSIAAEDRSGGAIQRKLHRAGLGRLTMPLDPGTSNRFTGASPLTHCRWYYGLACVFTAQVVVRPTQGRWGVRCTKQGNPLSQVSLVAKVENQVQVGERAIVHVEPMLACWEAGGDGVVVVEETTPQ